MSAREGKVPTRPEGVVSKCSACLIRRPGEPPVWLCARGRLQELSQQHPARAVRVCIPEPPRDLRHQEPTVERESLELTKPWTRRMKPGSLGCPSLQLSRSSHSFQDSAREHPPSAPRG